MLNGAISTLLAAFCLGASSTYVFRAIFSSLTIVVVASLFQGLFVLPVLLSIAGPHGTRKLEGKEGSVEGKTVTNVESQA